MEDRLSILALQRALKARRRNYAYLEIGSHLGGSLQPFLADPDCIAAFSIDPRPMSQPDERGVAFTYPGNSTERMLTTLRPLFGSAMSKLRTFEVDARGVPEREVDPKPDLCFIDGEDTDAAAQSDFEQCLRLCGGSAVIGFANVQLVFRGFARCLDLLDRRGIPHRAYVLPRKIGVIEIGQFDLWRDEAIHERLASPTAPLHIADTLAHYRDGILALKRLPGARLLRGLLVRLGVGHGLEPRRGNDGPGTIDEGRR